MDYREKLEAGLVHLKPILEAGGRSIEILEIDAPSVTIKVAGFCSGCACSSSYQEALQDFVANNCPDLTEVTFVE